MMMRPNVMTLPALTGTIGERRSDDDRCSMIPGSLVIPAHDQRYGPPPPARLLRGLAVVLLAGAVTATLAWVVLLSPFSLRRWDVFDRSQTITVTEPTTFVVYEEFEGADTSTAPPSVFVSIQSIGGRKITVTNRGEEGAPAPTVYRTPWHQGRSTAWFTIDKPGNYTVLTFQMGPANGGSAAIPDPAGPVTRVPTFDPSRLPRLALGREGTPSPLGTLGGLALLGLTPAVFGAGLLLVARRRWPPVELVSATRGPSTPEDTLLTN